MLNCNHGPGMRFPKSVCCAGFPFAGPMPTLADGSLTVSFVLPADKGRLFVSERCSQIQTLLVSLGAQAGKHHNTKDHKPREAAAERPATGCCSTYGRPEFIRPLDQTSPSLFRKCPT